MAKTVHKAQAGETFQSLAAMYKIPLGELYRLNKGVNTLSTGMGVNVPAPASASAPRMDKFGDAGGSGSYTPPTGTYTPPPPNPDAPRPDKFGAPGGYDTPHKDTYDPAGTSGGRRYVSPGTSTSTVSGDMAEINLMIYNNQVPPVLTQEEFSQTSPEYQQWAADMQLYVIDPATGNFVLRTSGDVNNGGVLPEGAMGTLASWSSGHDGYGYGINWDGRPLDSSGNAIGAQRNSNGSIIRNRAQNERRASLNRALSKESDNGGEGGESAGLVSFSWRV